MFKASMLKDSIAMSSFSVDDLEQAKDFYGNLLKLEVRDNPMGLIELHIKGGFKVMIYEKSDHTPASFTVLNFPVDDMETAVSEMTTMGIVFEQYGGELQTDARGISSIPDGGKIAWFKDPAGNILSLLSEK